MAIIGEPGFYLTRFIYPLKDKLLLSHKYCIYFDNPRTEDEVDDIYSKLCKHYSSEFDFKITIDSDDPKEATLMMVVQKFYSFFSITSEIKDPLYEIAKNWVILRSGSKDVNFLTNYTILILFYSFYGDYGDDYIDSGSTLLIGSVTWGYNERFLQTIQFWLRNAYQGIFNLERKDNGAELYDFGYNSKVITAKVPQIDSILDKEYDKIYYFSELLNEAMTTRSEKLVFTSLVSILEMILTHKPDFNRFNVEDSINKQFVLKLAIIVYQNDNSVDLISLKKELKEIYSQRSNIAHGNFKELYKFLEENNREIAKEPSFFGSKVKGPKDDYPLYRYNKKLFKYVYLVLKAYIDDTSFVKFIKEN